MIVQQAFALHPLVQPDEELQKHFELLAGCDPIAVALAMEYRWVANNGVRRVVANNGWKITLSIFPVINQMLVADKVQNRKDFLATFDRNDSANFIELNRYFDAWLYALNVTDEAYKRFISAL